MNDTKENTELIDYDCISRSRLIRQICEIDDVSINPKAFDRIMCTIQNQVPYNQVDYRDKQKFKGVKIIYENRFRCILLWQVFVLQRRYE